MTDGEKLNLILQEITAVKQEVATINQEMTTVKQEIVDIKMTLENVTNRNIRTIAEGHLDLSRKLNEALHVVSDIRAKQELQDILVTDHTDKLKKII